MRQKDVDLVVDTLSTAILHAPAEELPGLLVATGELRNAISWGVHSRDIDTDGFNRLVSQVNIRYRELRGVPALDQVRVVTPQDTPPPQDRPPVDAQGWGR